MKRTYYQDENGIIVGTFEVTDQELGSFPSDDVRRMLFNNNWSWGWDASELNIDPLDVISRELIDNLILFGDSDNNGYEIDDNFVAYYDLVNIFSWVNEFLSDTSDDMQIKPENDNPATSIAKIFCSRINGQFKEETRENAIIFVQLLFQIIDKLSSNRDVELNYSKFLSAFLQRKSYILENKSSTQGYPFYDNVTLNSDQYKTFLNQYTCDLLEFRKDMFKEVVIFNNNSKNKFDIDNLSIRLNTISKSRRNMGMRIHFSNLWNADKQNMYDVLNKFIKDKPEFGISSKNGLYYYDTMQSHHEIKMAGFLVALSERKWIKLFHEQSDRPLYDGKFLAEIINNFFQCNLNKKGESFQKNNLENLRDPMSLYSNRVEPLYRVIRENKL